MPATRIVLNVALAQGRIVFGPVRDPAPLFRDTVKAISIGLERHRGSRVTEEVVLLHQLSLHANCPIRAANSLPDIADTIRAQDVERERAQPGEADRLAADAAIILAEDAVADVMIAVLDPQWWRAARARVAASRRIWQAQ